MSFRSTVLCYGADSTLLNTRQQMLACVGFASYIARVLPEVRLFLLKNTIDVLLVCHSVPLEECRAAVHLAHSQLIPTFVLVLTKGTCCNDIEGVDAMFDTTEGPEKLVKTVAALLQKHVRGSDVLGSQQLPPRNTGGFLPAAAQIRS